MNISTIDISSKSSEMGLVILLVAQLLSAYMGAYVEDIYLQHGNHWKANLFYSHLLSLPLFANFTPVLYSQFQRLNDSKPFQVPKVLLLEQWGKVNG